MPLFKIEKHICQARRPNCWIEVIQVTANAADAALSQHFHHAGLRRVPAEQFAIKDDEFKIEQNDHAWMKRQGGLYYEYRALAVSDAGLSP